MTIRTLPVRPPSSPPRDEHLLSVTAAAKRYGVSRTTMFGYLRDGLLTRYDRAGDNNTCVDRRETDRFFAPRPRGDRAGPVRLEARAVKGPDSGRP